MANVLRMRMTRIKRYTIAAMCMLYTYYFFGVNDYLNAKSFEEFRYPLDIDVRSLTEEILDGESVDVQPINRYAHKFLNTVPVCDGLEKLDLLILVKSAYANIRNRMTIRVTFGQRNLVKGKKIRTVFFIGMKGQPLEGLNSEITRDVVQLDFIDDYYNNTNKTMMEFQWAFNYCNCADYYLFTDDDMYVSVPNIMKYLDEIDRNMTLAEPTESLTNMESTPELNSENKDKVLYIGHVINSAPIRLKSSKWAISLEEYPWSRWPPYITAGAYILSNRALKLMYVGSQYIQHFRFDDIYLGIVAMKLDIKLTHNSRIHFYKKKYSKDGYKDILASHGYGYSRDMLKVWFEQYPGTL